MRRARAEEEEERGGEECTEEATGGLKWAAANEERNGWHSTGQGNKRRERTSGCEIDDHGWGTDVDHALCDMACDLAWPYACDIRPEEVGT